MKLFGVPITYASREEILTQVGGFLVEPHFHRIATVNPEFLVLAEKNREFKQTLLAADLCVADGFGIVLVSWFQGKKITRYPGADLLDDILSIAERDGHSVFLAIKQDGLSSYEEIRLALLKKYSRLSVSGTDDAVEGIENWSASWRINSGNSAIVLCNFGAPEQEIFLEKLRGINTPMRLALGVGGAFDFLTGKVPRAPLFLRAYGLEWLWRLILQPKRWKRIWNAVAVFPVKVLLQK